MRGAVSAGRLTVVSPVLVNVTCTGTSPAPASEAGRVKLIRSQPGIFVLALTDKIAAPEIAVVPTVTVISPGVAPLTPVTDNSITVATVLPAPSVEVTLNGSPDGISGLVTLLAIARPPGPFASVKMSGWPARICINPR